MKTTFSMRGPWRTFAGRKVAYFRPARGRGQRMAKVYGDGHWLISDEEKDKTLAWGNLSTLAAAMEHCEKAAVQARAVVGKPHLWNTRKAGA